MITATSRTTTGIGIAVLKRTLEAITNVKTEQNKICKKDESP